MRDVLTFPHAPDAPTIGQTEPKATVGESRESFYLINAIHARAGDSQELRVHDVEGGGLELQRVAFANLGVISHPGGGVSRCF